MNSAMFRNITLAAAIVLAVSACGGGTGGTGSGDSGGSGGTGVSIGVMTKGSVIVNGVKFEDTTANISIDDTPKTAAALQNGMVVKVAGTVNDDGINGTAQRVKALIEVRGTPTSVNTVAQSLILLNQTVFADDQTVYSNLANFAAIVPNVTLIEVHGLRDATGQIRATRIEANLTQMGDATLDEIRGVVSNGAGTNPTSFSIGAQAVTVVGGAVIVPTGASYQNGTVVEVYCSNRPCTPGGVFQASRVKVEDAQDSAFQPSSGQRFEAEGLISGFTVHPGNFSVAGIPVTTTGSTRFEGGIATDLANNIKVEAEGQWNGTRLVASKIEFKRSVIRLQGTTANVNGTAQTFDLQIANNNYVVRIERDSLTNGVLPAAGLACVQVRGQRKVGASTLTVTAGEIDTSCSSSDRHFIQAPVEAEAPETTITLLGFSLNVSSPTDTPPWQDVNDQGISRTAFFNAVTPATTNAAGISRPGTLVKVIFNDNLSTVRQVEIED
jgi:hypothetical protein